MKRKFDKRSDGLFYNNHAYMIDGYIDDYEISISDHTENEPLNLTDLIDGKGYVDNKERIWIFYKDGPDKAIGIPWFTIKYQDNDMTKPYLSFSKFPTKEAREYFLTKNVGSYDASYIVKNSIPGEQLYDENILNDMNSATSVYNPEIDESDDFLKKLVKYTIKEKHVDVNLYKSAVNEKYTFSNLLSALKKKTKMSTTNFNTWAELLGINFTIIIEDDGRRKSNELKNKIIFKSSGETIEIDEDDK